MASAVNSTEPLIDSAVDCAACGTVHPLRDWIGDGDCPTCGEAHVVPVLPTARRAVERGDYEDVEFRAVVDDYRLAVADAADLLLALGCDASAALDVARVVVDGRPRSEWRRWIGETREQECRRIAEAEEALAEFGVSLEYPEE